MLRQPLVIAKTSLSLLAVQASFWLIFLNLHRLPPEVPLFYAFNRTEQILAPLSYYWSLPGIAAIILALNLAGAAFWYRKDRLLAELLLTVSLVLTLLTLLETLQIFRRMLY